MSRPRQIKEIETRMRSATRSLKVNVGIGGFEPRLSSAEGVDCMVDRLGGSKCD